jgi:hypothetical protein
LLLTWLYLFFLASNVPRPTLVRSRVLAFFDADLKLELEHYSRPASSNVARLDMLEPHVACQVPPHGRVFCFAD